MKKATLALTISALALPIANATDPPDVKEGLWSVHTEITNNPGGKKVESTYTLCRTHAFDQLVRDREKAMKGCSTVGENLQDRTYSSEVRCATRSTTIESKGSTIFEGDSSSHGDTRVTYTPALGGVSESTIITDQKFVGSCPDGTQPGDRINPDGTVIHLGAK
jgi:hypothetical protein